MSSYSSRLTMSKCLCHKSPKDKVVCDHDRCLARAYDSDKIGCCIPWKVLHCGHSYHDICIGDTKCKKCPCKSDRKSDSFLANRIEELTEAFNEGLLNDDDKDANRNEEDASQDLLLDDDDDDEDEIIGRQHHHFLMISKVWNCFAVNCQKNLIQLYDRVMIFFLFVTVNVISPRPRCSSRLAPFCFMKNSNTHACIVSALSI